MRVILCQRHTRMMMKAASGPKQRFRPLFLRILRDRAHLQDPPAPSWPTWGQCHCRMLVPYFYLLFPALFNELFYNLIMHEYSDIPFLKKKKSMMGTGYTVYHERHHTEREDHLWRIRKQLQLSLNT